MGRKTRATPTCLEGDGMYLTNTKDISNHLSKFYKNKIQKLRFATELGRDENISYKFINDIMHTENCTFKFVAVTEEHVKKLLLASKDKPPGTDNVDIKLLKLVADLISLPVLHIINTSLKRGIFPS